MTTPNLTVGDAVEEALCFGWIDSTGRRLDEHRSLLYIAPRKAGSGWSAVNKRRLEGLQAAGLLAAPGLACIEAAIHDGSWLRLDAAHALEVPPDLRAALEHAGEAATYWNAFPASAQRALLEWISNAKTDSTRKRCVRATAEGAARGERANQWRKKV
ncbi:YdeI/OmpD-associated family protein [Deinococcus frigens]|uniref:YdeI/OmpD-associated family protein n=1 Tax=Deinococcus frigens TaxID=249403 RepID=UPI001FE05276|nr:YdeI/OmpD-associated family protein [Deinococcus frigens]